MLRCAFSCVLIVLSATWLNAQSRPSGASRTTPFDSVLELVADATQETAPSGLDLDVRVMIWAPTALLPVSFLRLTHTPGGELQPNLFVWWLQPAGVPPDRLPQNRRCSAPGRDTPVCVASIEAVDRVDWGAVLANIFASRACSISFGEHVSVTMDAGDLAVRVYEAGTERYQEYKCNAPRGSARAGASQAAQVMDVLDKAAVATRQRW